MVFRSDGRTPSLRVDRHDQGNCGQSRNTGQENRAADEERSQGILEGGEADGRGDNSEPQPGGGADRYRQCRMVQNVHEPVLSRSFTNCNSDMAAG